jgi:hypothetical protein
MRREGIVLRYIASELRSYRHQRTGHKMAERISLASVDDFLVL